MLIGSNSGSGSLGNLLGGGSGFPTSNGGGNLGGILSQAGASINSGTTASGLGDSIMNLATSAASGNVAGIVTGIIGTIGAIFGGKHGVADHERPDLNTIAANNDITADQASAVCAYEEAHVSDNYDDICSRAANDNSYFLQLLNKYNSAHPNGQVRTQTVVATEQAAPQYLQLQQQLANSFAGTGKASPLANLSFPAAQAAAKQQNMSLQDYLTVIVNGALAGLQKGAGDAAADTPAGQQIKKDAINSWVKENQLSVAGAAVFLGWLGVQAYQNNSRK